MASNIEQKVVQALTALSQHTKLTGWTPISPGMDVSYEAGRRIGVCQGLDLALQHIIKTLADDEADDKDL